MALLTLLLRLCSAAAFARAGGGGSFHSSSGGSFHSSGGGGSFHGSGGGYSGSSSGYYSSDGDFIFVLIQMWLDLCRRHPLLGLIVTGAILYFMAQVYRAGDEWRVSRTISNGLEAQGDLDHEANLAALKGRDPAFEPEAFLARASSSFLAIQAAWSAMDMAPARALISDGVMERFTVQLAMLKALGTRNDMSSVSVESSEILQVESSAFWDVIHARIEASAVDRDVSLADGSVVRGDGEPASFVEVWTFARRPTARTLAGRGALEGSCPNCGTALTLIDGEQCSSCKSWLNSGEFDWVLCEITQASEWSARDAAHDAPGYPALAAKDPALNARFLEDRASVAFWRWQEALWSGAVKPLKPVAADELCARVERDLSEGTFYRDAAIGAVIALAFETGGARDRAHVIVRWSGERCERVGSEERRLGEAYMETVLILARNAGVQTDARSGLRSLRCPACGAPPSSRETAACEYCARSFNDGSMSWVLVDAVPASSWRVPAGIDRRPSPAPAAAPAEPAGPSGPAAPAAAAAAVAPAAAADDASPYAWAARLSPDAALRVMTAAMMADGKIEPEEQRYLVEFARSHGVAPETVAALVDAAQAGRLELPTPNGSADAAAFLRGVVVMSLTDGKVSSEERRAIDACAQALSLTPVEIDELIERERARLYAQAKDSLARRRAAS